MTSYSKLTSNGSEYFSDNMRIIKRLGDTNSSSNFNAAIENFNGDNSPLFNVGDEIEIFCDKTTNPPITKIFSGIIEDIQFAGKEKNEVINLSGRDHTTQLMDRTVEPEVYSNLTTGSIVKDIVAKYTDNITTTNVSDGTDIQRIVFNHTPVFDAIKELAELTGYMFYVDNSKDLHFQEKEAVSSGYSFGSGGTPILKTDYKVRRDNIFNDVWVYGDRYLDGFKETFTGDGAGSIFTLQYNPHSTSTTVNGNTVQPGAIAGMTLAPGSNVKYLVNYDDKQIIFTSGTNQGDNIPGNGSSVVVTYQRDLPIVKHGTEDSSISQYGRRVKVIQDTSIKDPLTAEAILTTELEEFSDPLKQAILNVQDIGNINVGETCIVNIPIYKVFDLTYNILEAKYDMSRRNLFDDSVLTIKVNKRIFDVTDTIKDLILQQKKLQGKDINTADLLTQYKISPGSVGIRHSGLVVTLNTITGSGYHVYGTGFTPPTNPFHAASGTDQGFVAGSFTGSASIFAESITWSGGYPPSTTPVGVSASEAGSVSEPLGPFGEP